MQQINADNLKTLRKDIDSVLEVIAEQHGISLTLGSFSYVVDSFTVKLTGICADSGGKVINPAEKAYNDHKINTMKNLDDSFKFQNDTYIIFGWKSRARKYPLLGKKSNGKIYKFPKEFAYKSGKALTNLF